MSKTLIVVESPSKAIKIQEFLGKDYVVLASFGHVDDLAKGGQFGIGIDVENDFKTRFILLEDKIQIMDNIINEAKKADLVLLCGDPDREGTAICQSIKNRLDGISAPIKRASFNKITKQAVLKGISEASEIDINVVNSQRARRILDRLVGFMASPFLMSFFGPKLSAGRVQSVVTRMVIDREREIESFIPEEFWTIGVNLSKDGKVGFQTKYSGRPADAKSAEDMKDKLSDTTSDYIVKDVVADEEKQFPQPPLVTSTLQQIMSKDHGFSADRTMKAAQSLYEKGYCSYIRTDSVRVSDESVEEIRIWLKNNNHIVPKKPYAYKNKDMAQDAHECIMPSYLELTPGNKEIFDLDEKTVYDVIWKQFVASQAMPAIYKTLKMTAHIKNDKKAEVKASGKALSSAGYLDVLGLSDDSKIEIPLLSVGDELKLFGLKPVRLEQKQTQPPPRYSEYKLIKELVNKNIGRPATYADLLTKITTRNYVEKKGSVFHATNLGKTITDELKHFFTFMDYNYTSLMENQLDEIESGKINHIDMLKKFYPIFKKELDKAYLSHNGLLCEKCGSPMGIKISKTKDKFYGCSMYPKCRNTLNIKNVA